MKKAINEDKDRLIEYLKTDVDNCVYLYIDIKTCDICSDNVNVWFDEIDGEITSVLMKYYDSFQVYARSETADLGWIVDKIDEYKVKMISGPRWVIERLSECSLEYETSYGSVFECVMTKEGYEDPLVEIATANDAREIAELLCSDPDFSNNYKVDVLEKQLAYRITKGLGRTYFAKADGKIVASTSTFAETDDLAVISGSIVDSKYRGTDCFDRIGFQINTALAQEGKRAFTFSSNRRMIVYLRLISRECGQYGKMHKKEDNSMSTEEKIALLEEIMDLDEGDLSADTVLDDIEEWDSLSKLSLIALAKKEFNLALRTDTIKTFVTVQDICDYLQ